ncbi:MAG: DUF695 domain-containing protein [Tenacibaculum sp.]|nr:DUF695 domain-containing protein [Tenacibaculum sp.]
MEIKQDWAFYFTLIDDKNASIRLNLALSEVAPIKDYSIRTWFGVKLLNPDENGMTTREEFPKICEIEDSISEILENNGAIMVGSIKNDGTMQMCFYSKDAKNHEELINSVMQNHSEYQYGTDYTEDNEWGYYFDFLYPSEYEYQTIQNQKIIMQLANAENNDELEREVDHWLYFATENDTENFIKEVKEIGYTILSKEEIEGEMPILLHISRNDTTIWGDVNNYVWELITIAKNNNGIYDGWGCPVAK